jgi:hypothetical protein
LMLLRCQMHECFPGVSGRVEKVMLLRLNCLMFRAHMFAHQLAVHIVAMCKFNEDKRADRAIA